MCDVKVVVEYAKQTDLYNSEPGKGSRELYDAKNASEKFLAGSDYLGVAANFFAMSLSKWAVKGQSIPRHVAKSYGEKHFLGSQPAFGSQPASQPKKIALTEPVGIAVVGSDPGAHGSWRRISLDLQTFAFVATWADLIREKPHTPETKHLLEQFREAALHCPMDFYVFPATSSDLEKLIFRKSFDIMESFRKKEDIHAPSGWQVCCLFNAAKELQAANVTAPSTAAPSPQKITEDSAHLLSFFADFDFADSSEYKQLDKRLAKDCLLVYERVMASGCATLLASTTVSFGPKNALDGVQKLITISQRVASSCPTNSPSDIAKRLKFVIEYFFVRMSTGSLDSFMGVRVVRSTMALPLLAHQVLEHVKVKYQYPRELERKFLEHFWQPLAWHKAFGSQPGSQPGQSIDTMMLQPSCKLLASFLRGVYDGKYDAVLYEVESQGLKNLTGAAILAYPKFGMTDITAMFNKEKVQAENAARFSSGSQPAEAPEPAVALVLVDADGDEDFFGGRGC